MKNVRRRWGNITEALTLKKKKGVITYREAVTRAFTTKGNESWGWGRVTNTQQEV